MSATTANMALKQWNAGGDFFSYSELSANWGKVDLHDHTTGKGVQIPAGGIATGAVTTAKIASTAVDSSKLASDSVTTAKILDANVTTAKIADANVTTAKILDANVTAAKLAASAKVASYSATITSSQILTTSYADLTGATLTFTPSVASTAVIIAAFDFDGQASNGSDAILAGRAVVDGTGQALGAWYRVFGAPSPATNFFEALITRVYVVSLTAASHTIKLQAKYTGTAVAQRASTDTSITVLTFPS